MTRSPLSPLSPPVLVALCWALTFAIAGLSLSLPEIFDLVPVFMAREDITLAGFSYLGSLWIGLCFLVYLTADLGAKHSLPGRIPFQISLDVNRAARLCFYANTIFLGITVLWIMTTARTVGGLNDLTALVYADSLAARDLLLQNKLFTGMRLFYAALPATGALAAVLLASRGAMGLSRRNRRYCQIILVANLCALLVLPIVMSQRLLLLQFLMSSYAGVCMVRGRIVGIGYLPLAMVLFLATWILREAVTNQSLSGTVLNVGMQKLAFYFVNDLWNSYRPLNSEISHTLGLFSLRGVLFFSFTDGYFAQVLSDRIVAIEEVRGGGDFSIFTAPYVDFGPFLGIVFVAVMAVVFRYAFWIGHQSVTGAVIYGQVAASLLFSTHGVYFTHQNFLFSVLVVVVLGRAAAPGPGRGVIAGARRA